jgi:outer membrane protein assembly factor BamA
VFGSYLNAKHRLDFEVGGFYSRDYTSTRFHIDSIFHDINTGGMLRVRYPFSVYSRMDLFGYYSHVQRKSLTKVYDSTTVYDTTYSGDTADVETTTVRTGSGRHLKRSFDVFLPTLSYVFDNVLWGLTGPVNGIRAAATVTAIPPLNTVNASFVSGDIDVRHYTHFDRRFVWANRVAAGASMSLKDGKAQRRYFLGGSENWLNYRLEPGNYESNLRHVFYSDFVVPFRGWDYFELTGSRFAVLNSEFRFPFVREISLAWPLPLEVRYINGAVFVDMGNAWNREDQHETIPLPKQIYGGVGFGLRVNLGMFVLRYDRAWKTDWMNYVKDPITYFSLGADF